MSARPRVLVEGVDPRTVFKVRAATRLNVEPRGLILLGDTADWTYFVVPLDEAASKLSQELAQYAVGGGPKVLEEFFGGITGIEPYGPSDRRGPGSPEDAFDGEIVVDVLLWPSGDDQEAARRLADVTTTLAKTNGTILTSDRRALTTMARVRVTRSGLEALLDLMVVERVRAPLAPFLEPSDWFNATLDELTTGPPIDVTVGLIDDGIHAGHALLANLVTHQLNIPDNREWGDPSHHGSMVAGLVAYGDIEQALRDHTAFPSPVRLAIARVLEPDPADPTRTRFPTDQPEHVIIENAIRALHAHGVRIVNISINDIDGYSGPHVSIWTETLDRLARELDVVLVVSAGNRPLAPSGEVAPGVHAHTNYPTYALDPEARIAEPAVAANVVTVGSIARSAASAQHGGRSQPQDIAIEHVNELSPFSRTGPGVNGTHQLGAIKPEFVHHGGNTVWSSIGRLNHTDPGAAAVSTALSPTGRLFAIGSGTSYAAPRIARSAAEILERYPNASANLIRALLGVSARIPDEAVRQFGDTWEMHRAFGYGMPDVRRAVESDPSRVVLIHEGEVAANTAVIHPIPMPTVFTSGKADRTIITALAYDPPVRRQRREYIAGHLALDFYRAMTLDEVEAVVRKQEKGTKVALPGDRRRIADKLTPGPQTCGASTLQVRSWRAPAANSLLPDDSDTYYLVVKQFGEAWAGRLTEPYETQRYALAVQLEDRTRVEVDLYATIEAQVRAQEQARLRLGGQ